MNIFTKVFIQVFAFFTALFIFITLFSVLIFFITYDQDNKIFNKTTGNTNSANKIAVLKLNGPILENPPMFYDFGLLNKVNVIYTSQIKEILGHLEIEKINGLVVSINSPGGSVSATHTIYNLLKNFSKKNSIDIFFHTNELMASGAYWVALSGKKIYANYGSLIGSIGVKGPDWIYFDSPISISSGIIGQGVETKNGIKKFTNISGNSKDLFNSFRSPTNKERIDLQNITKNIYFDFVKDVEKNRKIEADIIINNIGAMIFDSKTAKENHLIDEIITLDEVIKKMAKHLSIKEYQIIEREYDNNNFIYDIFISNFKIQTNFNALEKIIDQNVCDFAKYGISTIFLNTRINSSC